jgi:hypothetical protein
MVCAEVEVLEIAAEEVVGFLNLGFLFICANF